MSDGVLEDPSCFSAISILLINLVICLMNTIQNSVGRHETGAIVNNESATSIVLVS